MNKLKLFILVILIISLIFNVGCFSSSTDSTGNDNNVSQFDESIKQLIYSCLTLYLLSIFISFFDNKTASFLKKIAFLNLASILIIFGINLYAILFKFTNALDRISQFKIF